MYSKQKQKVSNLYANAAIPWNFILITDYNEQTIILIYPSHQIPEQTNKRSLRP